MGSLMKHPRFKEVAVSNKTKKCLSGFPEKELKVMEPKSTNNMSMEKVLAFMCIRRKKNKNKQPWSDLPTELLEYIMAGLYLDDITNFHAVCKRWSAIERLPTQLLIRYGYQFRHLMNQIPWLMMINCYPPWSLSCTLIDPSSSIHKKTHTIKLEGIGSYYSKNTRICSTKFGWLLLSRPTIFCFRRSFFLYSPFINERIDLPDLDSCCFHIANFSSVPNSPDCIFFVFHHTYTGRVTISICRQGDKAWSSSNFSSDGFSPMDDVVYLKGMFYCSTIHGKLGAFDVSQQSWSILSEPRPILIVNPPRFGYNSFMVGDENEKLLLVHLSNSDHWALVHKLDRSKMKWVKLESLKDKSLFVSSLDSTSVVVSKNKRTKRLMNRIYYCLPNEPPKFYCFKASKCYQCSSTYGDLPVKVSPKKFFWIEPPY